MDLFPGFNGAIARWPDWLDSYRFRPVRSADDDLVAVFAHVAYGFPRRGNLRREQAIINCHAGSGIERRQCACLKQGTIEDRWRQSGRKWRGPELKSTRPRHSVPRVRGACAVVLPQRHPWEILSWEAVPCADSQLGIEDGYERPVARHVQQNCRLVTPALLVKSLPKVATAAMDACRDRPAELLVLREQIVSVKTALRGLSSEAGDGNDAHLGSEQGLAEGRALHPLKEVFRLVLIRHGFANSREGLPRPQFDLARNAQSARGQAHLHRQLGRTSTRDLLHLPHASGGFSVVRQALLRASLRRRTIVAECESMTGKSREELSHAGRPVFSGIGRIVVVLWIDGRPG